MTEDSPTPEEWTKLQALGCVSRFGPNQPIKTQVLKQTLTLVILTALLAGAAYLLLSHQQHAHSPQLMQTDWLIIKIVAVIDAILLARLIFAALILAQFADAEMHAVKSDMLAPQFAVRLVIKPKRSVRLREIRISLLGHVTDIVTIGALGSPFNEGYVGRDIYKHWISVGQNIELKAGEEVIIEQSIRIPQEAAKTFRRADSGAIPDWKLVLHIDVPYAPDYKCEFLLQTM